MDAQLKNKKSKDQRASAYETKNPILGPNGYRLFAFQQWDVPTDRALHLMSKLFCLVSFSQKKTIKKKKDKNWVVLNT